MANDSPLHTILLLAANAIPGFLRVILVVTVNGTPDVLIDGVIERQEIAPGDRARHSTLTVSGEDLTLVMDQEEFSGIPYPAMPAVARVALICAKYAMFGIVPLPVPPHRSRTSRSRPTGFPCHEGTDLAYLNQLAERGRLHRSTSSPARSRG